MISIVLVTFNRLHLLRQCVQNVLARTSMESGEILIWNNRSTDGTREYLDTLRDPRIKVINSDENVGTNAYALAFPKTAGEYMIELDDDIIDAPQDWDLTMLAAFKQLPKMGFLAAEVMDDGKSVASEIRYRKDAHRYKEKTINGVNVTEGPVGGWCTMTSREIYEEVGGFKVNTKFNFWHEDGAYVGAVHRAGYSSGLLTDLKVFHASGPAYSYDPEIAAAKARYYGWYEQWLARRKAIRCIIDRTPIFGTLYAKFKPRQS